MITITEAKAQVDREENGGSLYFACSWLARHLKSNHFQSPITSYTLLYRTLEMKLWKSNSYIHETDDGCQEKPGQTSPLVPTSALSKLQF